MKKIIAVMLAVIMATTLVALVACNKVVHITVYDKPDGSPVIYEHTVGKDDLPKVTNGDLEFLGWYLDSAYTKPFDPVKDTDIADGIILYAKWEQKNTPVTPTDKVTLTLNLNYTGSTTITVELDKNDTYTLPSPARTGYTLDGWYTQDVDGIKWTDSTRISADTTLYAHWTPVTVPVVKVTLTLDYNYTGSNATTIQFNKDSVYSLQQTPTRAGYTFDGWYTQAEDGTKCGDLITMSEDITIYAHWTPLSVADLSDVFAKYSDVSTWNFAVNVTKSYNGEQESIYYEYIADEILFIYQYDGVTYTEYLGYDSTDAYCYFEDDGEGTYTKYDKDSDEFFYIQYSLDIVNLADLGNYTFYELNGCYQAAEPDEIGKAVIADYDDGSIWTSVTLYVANGNVTKLVGVMDDGYTMTFEFSKHGQVNFTLPDDSPAYTITIDASKSTVIEVGAEVNFTEYFTITDKDGANVTVTESMLDLSNVDTSKAGTFTVTVTCEDVSKQLTFVVVEQGADITTTPAELTEVFEKYADKSAWNFAVLYTTEDGSDEYEYLGLVILNRYQATDGNTYVDYLDMSGNVAYIIADNGDGTYTKYGEDTDEFSQVYMYLSLIDLSSLIDYTFVKAGDVYVALNPSDAGNAVLGQYTNYSWASVTVSIEEGEIAEVVGVMDDGYVMTYTLSKHGQVSFTVPEASEGGNAGDDKPVTPGNTMEEQVYNANTFDDETLQDKLIKTGEYADPYIGLPATGSYTALVVPIKFSNTTISQTQLDNLNIAFNGTSEQTGWESVKTYYQKASYGKLNLSFDIAGVNMDGISYYTSNRNYSYYESLTATSQGQKYNNGDNVLLHEVLNYYKAILDLSKYDTDGDGCIDAIYLIYSAPVDYSEDSFYWAHVTWDSENTTKYDGKDAYYYLFAGLDFMKENVKGGKVDNQSFPEIKGLKVNASTYIHETGHLLGLDDYYDYYPNEGCNEGLGGADMMDYTVGDQNVYSKTMLGWLTPEIITSTQTVTIKSSQAKGDAILIPLKWDNSYFCEYLLIDLYSASGLNELHATMNDTLLYNGASYGVRIYHVTAWIENAFDNEFGSFTDNNNSISDIALIKLVEADGEKKFASSDGYAMDTDLWQAGDSLNSVFPNYTRNDGKLLNFNVTIDSVSAEEATITITYNTSQAA